MRKAGRLIALGLAAFLAAGAGYSLPQQAAAQQTEFARQQQIDKERRQLRYEDCVTKSEQSYRREWSNNCRSFSQSASQRYAACLLRSASAKSECSMLYPSGGDGDCRLPRTIAYELRWFFNSRNSRCRLERDLAFF